MARKRQIVAAVEARKTGGRRIARLLLLLTIVLVPMLGQFPQPIASVQAQSVPSGNVIVVLEGRTVPAAVQAVVNSTGFSVSFSNVFTGFAMNLTQAQATALAQADGVLGVYADAPVELAWTAASGVNRVGAPSAAQSPNPTMVDATVAVVDSGVDASHSNLNVIGGFDAYAAVVSNSGVDCGALTAGQQASYEAPSTWGSSGNSGHGTHVAGIIGAEGGNNVVGVAPGAGILGVKVFNSAGTSGTTTTIACGLDWVLANQSRFSIDVVNMSMQGGAVGGGCNSDAIHVSICAIYNAGMPIAVAAGNKNGSPGTLGVYSEVVAVSAFNDYNGLSGGGGAIPCDTSTQAPDADDKYSTYNLTVPVGDILAPGTCIYSTWPGGGYNYDSGTSMASPHVAGALAIYKSANPGSSAADAVAWLSTVSVPQTDPDGLVNPGQGNGEPVLHLGAIPPKPAEKFAITGSSQSSGSSPATNTYDNNMATSWTTASTTPANGWFYVDLGGVKPIGTVKYVVGSGLGNLMDSWQIQLSNDKTNWTSIANRGNASPKSWKEQIVNVNARYVRFYFNNPNSDVRLGGIAEIEVWPATGSTTDLPTPTVTPTPSVTPYTIAGSAQSSGSSPATNTYDGNMATSWTTASNTPASGWFYVDLGAVKPIGTVRYVVGSGLGSLMDSWQLQVSNDKTNWTTVASRGNASPKSWKEQAVNRNARYVRFLFGNPNAEPRLGGIAEIEVLSASGATTDLPTPTATPTLTPYTITGVAISPGSTAGQNAYDGNMSTVWVTTGSNPSSAYIYFSLGEIKPIGTVRYVFGSGYGGYADSWRIEVSNDKINWKYVAGRGNASPKSWKEQVVNVNAKYVRFIFANPNGDPKLGGIAEVEILPATGSVASIASEGTATATPTATPSATPTTPPGTPYAIAESDRSADSAEPTLAYDGNLTTEWITTAKTPPTDAYLSVSIGDVQPIGDLQWLFTETGYAKQYDIQISNDGTTWTTVATKSDAPAMTWQSLTIGQSAKYVRFLFSNPTGTAKLGGIGEIRVLKPEGGSPTTTATVTATATVTETTTATETVTETPTDVATETPTEVPTETATPTEVPTEIPTEVPTEPGTPEGASESSEQPQIQSVTEEATEVPTEEPTEIPTEVPTEIPTEVPTEAPWTPGPGYWPAAAGQSDNSEQAARAFDSDLTTDWRTFDGAGLQEATLTVDLGQVSWVSETWWYLSANPPGGRIEIEISADGETWQVVSQPSYLGDPGTWVNAPLGVEARYVRFHFYNDDGRSSLGGLAEIVILP